MNKKKQKKQNRAPELKTKNVCLNGFLLLLRNEVLIIWLLVLELNKRL